MEPKFPPLNLKYLLFSFIITVIIITSSRLLELFNDQLSPSSLSPPPPRTDSSSFPLNASDGFIFPNCRRHAAVGCGAASEKGGGAHD